MTWDDGRVAMVTSDDHTVADVGNDNPLTHVCGLEGVSCKQKMDSADLDTNGYHDNENSYHDNSIGDSANIMMDKMEEMASMSTQDLMSTGQISPTSSIISSGQTKGLYLLGESHTSHDLTSVYPCLYSQLSAPIHSGILGSHDHESMIAGEHVSRHVLLGDGEIGAGNISTNEDVSLDGSMVANTLSETCQSDILESQEVTTPSWDRTTTPVFSLDPGITIEGSVPDEVSESTSVHEGGGLHHLHHDNAQHSFPAIQRNGHLSLG